MNSPVYIPNGHRREFVKIQAGYNVKWEHTYGPHCKVR